MIKAIFILPGDNDGEILPSLLRPWQRYTVNIFLILLHVDKATGE